MSIFLANEKISAFQIATSDQKILVQLISISSFLITAKIRLIWSFQGVGKSHRELNLTEQIRRALGKLTAAFGTCSKSTKTREAIYPITLEIFHVFCYYRTVLFRQSLESEAKILRFGND